MWRSGTHKASPRPAGYGRLETRTNSRSSDVPTASSSDAKKNVTRDSPRTASHDALEMFISVSNLQFNVFATKRSTPPRVFVALLVEAPGVRKTGMHLSAMKTVSTKKPQLAKSAELAASGKQSGKHLSRHVNWVVVGVTEPLTTTKNVMAHRFCVPLRLDGLCGTLDRNHETFLKLRSEKTVLALFRLRDDDHGDDVFVNADWNLPAETRGVITTERLDEMQYLGETNVDLVKVLRNVSKKGGLDGGKNAVRSTRHRYALSRNQTRYADAGGDASPLKTDTNNSPIGLEILVSVLSSHPSPPPNETGRVVCDFLVTFSVPSLGFFFTPDENENKNGSKTISPNPSRHAPTAPRHTPTVDFVWLRFCRWVGDGYAPVYSSLVTGTEQAVGAVERWFDGDNDGGDDDGDTSDDNSGKLKPNKFVARVPTTHVPIACLTGGGGGGGTSCEPGRLPDFRRSGDDFSYGQLPSSSPHSPWRVEIVARLSDNRDVLLGSLDTSPGELHAAGVKVANGDGPVLMKCDDLVPSDHDFQPELGDENSNETVLLLERWSERPGDTKANKEIAFWRFDSRRAPGVHAVSTVPTGNVLRRESIEVDSWGDESSSSDEDDSIDFDATPVSKSATTREKQKTPPKTIQRPPTPFNADSDSTYSDTESHHTNRGMMYIHAPAVSRKFRTSCAYDTTTLSDVGTETTETTRVKKSPRETRDDVVATPTRLLVERARAGNKLDGPFRHQDMRSSFRKDMTNLGVPSTRVGVPSIAAAPKDAKGQKNSKENCVKISVDPPTVAATKFKPDPGLIQLADDAVRNVVTHRLLGEEKGELIHSALRLRRELLKKLTSELRVLEQRARRETRVGGRGGDL